jgi:hypothetical protein
VRRTEGVQTKAYKEPAKRRPGELAGAKGKVVRQKQKPAPRTLGIQDFGRWAAAACRPTLYISFPCQPSKSPVREGVNLKI